MELECVVVLTVDYNIDITNISILLLLCMHIVLDTEDDIVG